MTPQQLRETTSALIQNMDIVTTVWSSWTTKSTTKTTFRSLDRRTRKSGRAGRHQLLVVLRRGAHPCAELCHSAEFDVYSAANQPDDGWRQLLQPSLL